MAPPEEGTMTGLRTLVERHYSNIAAQDQAADADLFHADVITVHPGMPPMHGLAAFHEFTRAFHAGVPDMALSLNRAYDAGDSIIVEGTFTGTHTGTLHGPDGEIPPTGRPFELEFCDLFELRDGKIAAHRIYYDQLSLFTQLGLLPAATPA